MRPLALEALLAVLGAEGDEHLARPLALAEGACDVGRRLELERPRSSLFGRLAASELGGPVVGDGGGEQGDVEVGGASAASSIASAVGVGDRLDAGRRRDGEVRGEQDDLGPAPPRLLGERDAHPARGAVADEADGVDRLARAARGDEHAPPGERGGASSCSARAAISSGSAMRPTPHSPSAVSPSSGPTSSTPRATQRLDVRARRRVRPHARVHRRRDEHRAAMGERRLGQQVVGEPVGELRERVRRAGRDDEQVGAGEVRVEVLRPAGGRAREGLGPDEALGARA